VSIPSFNLPYSRPIRVSECPSSVGWIELHFKGSSNVGEDGSSLSVLALARSSPDSLTLGHCQYMREGVHVTTTTGVTQESYEMSMDHRGRPFDGTASTGGTAATDIKHKAIDDGLSLRSDSDAGVEDVLGNRKKLADEETSPACKEFPVTPVQPRVQVQAQPQGGRGVNDLGPNYRHPYVNMLSPSVPPRAK
jgi:hypothetical protein